MRIIKAVKIFDGETFLPHGSALVFRENGVLAEITSTDQIPPDKIEHLEGILTPGFINTHCHLELSHLRTVVSKGKGFVGFAIELMEKRGKTNPCAVTEAMQEAEKEMVRNGIVAVGDISNSDTSLAVKREKKLRYHTFIELIGLDPAMAPVILKKGKLLLDQFKQDGQRASLAPHAPYSVSNELIALISLQDQHDEMPLSIHNQESVEEQLFFMGEKSQVHDLYKHLNINIGFFRPPRSSSMTHYLPALLPGQNILVHNTFSSADDVRAGNEKNVTWCFCPGANLYIESRLPDFDLFTKAVSRLCIGTDSLASNHQLDVIAELNLFSTACGGPTTEQLLSMVCSNGAKALGIDQDYGKLIPGKAVGLNLLTQNGSKFELIKRIF